MDYQENVLDILEIIEKSDVESNLIVSSMLAKSSVPFSHRKIADNYFMMKKLCGFQVAQPRISNEEKQLLERYHFDILENTTIDSINSEISLLKEWALSTEDCLRQDAEEILKIRVKELKFIYSNKYAVLSNELYMGYKAIEVYLVGIAKFYSLS